MLCRFPCDGPVSFLQAHPAFIFIALSLLLAGGQSINMTDQPDSGKKIGDGRENWTEKRIHNTNYFRSAALVGAVAIAGYTTSSSSTGRVALSEQASATLHLVSFGTGLGTMMYTTFVLGITMFQALPRRTFGLLQAQLFPRYFTLCSCTLLVQVSLTLWFDIRNIKKFQTHPTGVFFVFVVVPCLSLSLFRSLPFEHSLRRHKNRN